MVLYKFEANIYFTLDFLSVLSKKFLNKKPPKMVCQKSLTYIYASFFLF